MFRKISFQCLTGFVFLLSTGVSFCLAGEDGLNQAKENICSLINAGKFTEAKMATDKLAADFAGEPNLPEARHQVGVYYERASNFEEAKSNFQQIIQSHPDSPFANKARLGISRAEAMSFVMTEKFDKAKEAIDKMAVDFAGNPDLPGAMYWTTERFTRFDRFEDAKRLFQKIVQNFPDSPWAGKSRFFIARADITSLIISGKYDQAQKALDKLAIDFAGNPELCNVTYWNAERFERQNRFEEAKNNYQKIVQSYPNSSYVERAKLGVSRANAMSLIVAGDYDGAKAALDKMSVDFAGNPELPGAIYWIAVKYESTRRQADAIRIYQQITQKFPSHSYAGRARIRIAKYGVTDLIDAQDYDKADEALNKMIVEYSGNPELAHSVYTVGEKYFVEAKAPDYRQRTIRILEKAMYDLPRSEAVPGMYAELYCCAGDCYLQMGEHAKAIECFQRIISTYPDYKFAWHAHSMTGLTYQRMKNTGLISAAEADAMIRAAYEYIIVNYPDCPDAGGAKAWLDKHKPKK